MVGSLDQYSVLVFLTLILRPNFSWDIMFYQLPWEDIFEQNFSVHTMVMTVRQLDLDARTQTMKHVVLTFSLGVRVKN